MSSVSGVSVSQGSSLAEQLTAAVTHQKTDEAKQLATTLRQTQSKSYLGGLLDSIATSDAAASETLQVMNQVLTDAHTKAAQKIDARIEREASASVKKDMTNTPFTQTTDATGQIVDLTA